MKHRYDRAVGCRCERVARTARIVGSAIVDRSQTHNQADGFSVAVTNGSAGASPSHRLPPCGHLLPTGAKEI